ncbi:hypothetical protein Scep_023234 [Stephania cephalantha]|uniref:Ubiquitin-like domain-containing protein n=1 Tax=Stephania cephalantha TaxID=152367 RepID=A0AAP0F3B2_9MAGN
MKMKKKIEIKSETGEFMGVEVGESDTLGDIKQKILHSQGIAPDINSAFHLGCMIDAILANKPHLASIEDDRTASVITVVMVLRFRGGRVRRAVVVSSSSDSDSSSEADLDEGDGQQMESLPFELNGRRLQIHVTSPAGSIGSIPVEIAPTDTVNDLKQKIFEKVNVIPDDQRLVMGNSLVQDGVVFDRVLAILGREPYLANKLLLQRHEAAPGPDTGTVHVTIIMVKRLRGGGNAVFHQVQLQSGSSDSDCNSDANTVSDEVQGRQRSRLIMPDISNENKNLKNVTKLSVQLMEGEVVDVKRMMEEIEIKSLTGKRIAVEVGVSDMLHARPQTEGLG